MLLPQLHWPGLPAALGPGLAGGGLRSDKTEWRVRRGKGWQGRSRLSHLQTSEYLVPLCQSDIWVCLGTTMTAVCPGHQPLACACHWLVKPTTGRLLVSSIALHKRQSAHVC